MIQHIAFVQDRIWSAENQYICFRLLLRTEAVSGFYTKKRDERVEMF